MRCCARYLDTRQLYPEVICVLYTILVWSLFSKCDEIANPETTKHIDRTEMLYEKAYIPQNMDANDR